MYFHQKLHFSNLGIANALSKCYNPKHIRKEQSFHHKGDYIMKKMLTMLLALSMLLSMGFATTASAAEITDWKTYAIATNEITDWNLLKSQAQAVSSVLGNCYDSLLTNDPYGALIPNLAKEYYSEDGGKTWTFKLNEGVQWVDKDANPKAEVVASDWMWGLEWILNYTKNETYNISMPIEMIEGAEDYYNYTKELAETEGEDAAYALGLEKFQEMVGVECPDDYTLIYHCNYPMSYFPSVATYTCLYPLAPGVVEEVGGAKAYTEATWDQLWYNGPYTLTEFVHANEKVMTANPTYWNKDNVKTFNTVTVKMVESQDVAFNLFQTGEIDHVTLSQSTVKSIMENPSSEWYPYLSESRVDIFARSMYFNYDKRLDTEGTPDTNWNKAIGNLAFRKSWYYGLDWTSFLARTNAVNPLSIQNHAFTSRGVSVNSQGVDYVDMVLERLGVEPNYETYDRVNKELFEQYKTQAIEELTAEGVTFPVEVDYWIASSNQTSKDDADTLKQIFSDCLGDDYVTLNIKTYISSASNEVTTPRLNGISFVGWGADYADPSNFLGLITYGEDSALFSGYTTHINDSTDEDLVAEYKEYTRLVDAGRAITDDIDARLAAFAEAEAYAIEHVLIMPVRYSSTWQLTCVNDYSKIYSAYGTQGDRYINWETNSDIYTAEDIAEFKAAYEAK